jgi:hypothetical protein
MQGMIDLVQKGLLSQGVEGALRHLGGAPALNGYSYTFRKKVVFGSFDIAMPSDSPDLRISAIFDELLTITLERVAACRLGVPNRLDGPVLRIMGRTLHKLGNLCKSQQQ